MEREWIMKAPKNPSTQPRLFQVIDMEDLVPPHHILRQINEAVDFSVIHDWVAPLYTEKTGRPAADPERLLRLMLLSYLFDHSERELYEILPMHAGYLWFCGLDFESVLHPDPHHPTLPDRTTLVKTRKRWRQHGIFDRLMTYVVDQCIAAGLVSPDVYAAADGTQVRANASIHSLREIKLAPVETLEDYLARTAREDEQTESPEADRDPDDDPPSPSPQSGERAHAEERGNFRGTTFSNQTHRSVTDPDARLYKKGKGQEAYPRYLVHDVIDVRSRVILSRKVSVATGTAERETSLEQLASIRFRHPSITIRTLSADKAYGTTEYLEALFAQGITPLVSLRRKEMEEIPTWKRRAKDPAQEAQRQAKVREVQIRNQARLIQQQGGYRSIQALRTRCEHVFAEGKECHGLDRARSRGLDAMEEQALLTAVVQNLKRLCRFRKKRGGTGSLACAKTEFGAGSPARPPVLWRQMAGRMVSKIRHEGSLCPINSPAF
ncbi:transposase [Anoxybacteroides amylolyticum]|uniref:Transposase DDE domain protein n=1 Tax=Anoxybacteroides amylolyticum TaxID=294699 RepID=A0A167TB88_9BACL|nr:transposase [Anoxybacillus amylolyticus]ANB59870.1 transposase DDE domain protein [Anoxybacillus amylolyticus]